MRSGTKFLWLLLALCFLLMPVWNSVSPVSAQNGSDDALDLLEEEAERQNKTLGSYLWDLLNGGFQSLGDLAAGTLEAFLEEGGTLQVENMTITLSGSDAGNSETGHEAYYDIVLKNGDSEEAALLILHMDAVRLYVNEKIYPQMVEGSGDSRQIRSDVKADMAKLLERLNIVPKDGSSVGNRVWEQLSNHLEDYRAFESMMKIPTDDNDGDGSNDDLMTIWIEDDGGETNDLENYLNEINEGGEGQSGGSSDGAIHLTKGNEVVAYSKALGADQVSSSTVEILEDLEDEILDLADSGSGDDESENGGSGNGGASGSDGIGFLMDTVLPATGFSSGSAAVQRGEPLSIASKATGMSLQIPELDVSAMIFSISGEAGRYSIEWLDRNVGMLDESSLPGSGVTVLTGHNHLSAAEAGPFLFIGTLEKGDRIFITDSENELFAYKVYGNYKIAADDFAAIAGGVHENTLILITCEDESAEGGYLSRRVIFADPV